MKKLLGIVVLGLLLSVTAYGAEQTKARYEKIAQEFTKNPNAKIKSPIKYKLKPTTNESETIPTSIFLSLLLNIKDAESKIIEIIKNGWQINLKKWTKCLEMLRP